MFLEMVKNILVCKNADLVGGYCCLRYENKQHYNCYVLFMTCCENSPIGRNIEKQIANGGTIAENEMIIMAHKKEGTKSSGFCVLEASLHPYLITCKYIFVTLLIV